MPWNPSLNEILPKLADLYGDEEDARRIATEAGLRPEHIDLSGKAINIWHSILEEALRQDKIAQLFERVGEEYPQFSAAAANYKSEQTSLQSDSRKALQLPNLSWVGWVVGLVVVGLVGFFLTRQYGTTSSPTAQRFYVAQQLSGEDLELAITLVDPNNSTTAREFLRLSVLEWGRYEGKSGEAGLAYNIKLVVKNVFAEPLLLDIDQGYFSLEDSLARPAPMIYFCCSVKGKTLASGEEREFQLMFGFLPGWTGKGGPKYAQFKVQGLRPVLSATKRVSLPKVAN